MGEKEKRNKEDGSLFISLPRRFTPLGAKCVDEVVGVPAPILLDSSGMCRHPYLLSSACAVQHFALKSQCFEAPI